MLKEEASSRMVVGREGEGEGAEVSFRVALVIMIYQEDFWRIYARPRLSLYSTGVK